MQKLNQKKSFKSFFQIFRKVICVIIGFLIGVFFGFMFYNFVLIELNLDPSFEILILANVIIFLSVGFAFSIQLRCITCLTIPEFSSTSGKRFLQACILIMIISGPVENIGRNSQEALRLVVCLKDLTVNITMAGKDLLFAPVQHIIYDLKTQEVIGNSKFDFTELKALLNPVRLEVEDERETALVRSENDYVDSEMGYPKRSKLIERENPTKPQDSTPEKIQKAYQRKIAYRCEEIFTKATEKCKDVFAGKYDECYETVTKYVAWALCWPMKITFICDIIGMFTQERMCDTSSVIGDDFGENYVAATKGIGSFTQKFKVKVDYAGFTNFVNIKDKVDQMDEEAMAIFLKTKARIDFYINLIKRMLAFTFIFLVFSAISYHGSYLEHLSFDNCYLSSYFKKIDAKRFLNGKSTLIPLKSYERIKFSRTCRISLDHEERRRFTLNLIIILIQGTIASVLFIFDYLFTNLLELVQNHVDITFRQKGSHRIDFHIEGKGFLAQLLRSIVSDINVHKDIDLIFLTKHCLPSPNYIDQAYIRKTLLLFTFLILASYLEAISIRIRHIISNYFYPKKAKERILWLYNETKRRRIGKLIQLKEQVLQNADEFRKKVDFQLVFGLLLLCPKFCFRKFSFLKKSRCILCKRLTGNNWECSKCHFHYCQECFEDLNERCLYCIASKELHEKMYEDEAIDYAELTV